MDTVSQEQIISTLICIFTFVRRGYDCHHMIKIVLNTIGSHISQIELYVFYSGKCFSHKMFLVKLEQSVIVCKCILCVYDYKTHSVATLLGTSHQV